MKPKRILLVRHGQSQGNVDPEMYSHTPDYQLELTENGIMQAQDAGMLIKDIVKDGKIQFYVSPLWRTRSTFLNIIKAFSLDQIRWVEEPRIREQEWGHLRNVEESRMYNDARDNYGTFYYRLPDGESGADVYDRVSSFMGSLHRDFEKEDFPETVVIVTHGMAIRLFLMKWFHWTVEEFEAMRNPYNCQVFVMEKNEKNKYDLKTEVTKYDVLPAYKNKNQRPLVIPGTENRN